MENIFVRTRLMTMVNIRNVEKWLDQHATGSATISGMPYKKYIQKYCEEHEGNRKIHRLKVAFFNETDARRFLMDWG